MAGGIDYSKVDPKTRQLIEKVQKNRPDVLSLEELKKATAKLDALLVYLQKQNRTAEKTSLDLADVLFDVKESLDEFSSQEAPEMPDFAQPVVKAVEDLKTALTGSIKAIEVSPKIAAPNVKVDAPKVDLSGVENAVKEVSKAFEAAIKKIPKTEIPKTDFKPLLQKFDVMLEKLGEIDTGVRLKPQTPNIMKVTNVDGSAIGGGNVTVQNFPVDYPLPTGQITALTPQTNTLTDTELRANPVATTDSPVKDSIDALRGFQLPEYDEIQLGYTGEDLTTVDYYKANVKQATLTLSYTLGKLTGVVQS